MRMHTTLRIHDIPTVTVSNPSEQQRTQVPDTTPEPQTTPEPENGNQPVETSQMPEKRFWDRTIDLSANPETGSRSYRAKSENYEKLHENIDIKQRESDYGAFDNPDIHDNNMWHTHVTQLQGGYKPGETVSLADNPYLAKIVAGNKKNNFLFLYLCYNPIPIQHEI